MVYRAYRMYLCFATKRNNPGRLQNERLPHRIVSHRIASYRICIFSVTFSSRILRAVVFYVLLIDSRERFPRVLPFASVLVVPYCWYARLGMYCTGTHSLAPLQIEKRQTFCSLQWSLIDSFVHLFVRVPCLLRWYVYSTTCRTTTKRLFTLYCLGIEREPPAQSRR